MIFISLYITDIHCINTHWYKCVLLTILLNLQADLYHFFGSPYLGQQAFPQSLYTASTWYGLSVKFCILYFPGMQCPPQCNTFQMRNWVAWNCSCSLKSNHPVWSLVEAVKSARECRLCYKSISILDVVWIILAINPPKTEHVLKICEAKKKSFMCETSCNSLYSNKNNSD